MLFKVDVIEQPKDSSCKILILRLRGQHALLHVRVALLTGSVFLVGGAANALGVEQHQLCRSASIIEIIVVTGRAMLQIAIRSVSFFRMWLAQHPADQSPAWDQFGFLK